MQTVFILYDHSLFARGLEKLLREGGEVKVMGVEALGEQAFSHIRELKPDVIIMEADEGESEPEMLLFRFLKDRPEARLIRLNPENNSCILYSGWRRTANTVEDLLKCVLVSAATTRQERCAKRFLFN